MQKGTKQGLGLVWQVFRLLILDQRRRVWRNAITATLRRENPWGCRSLVTVEQFFKTVSFEVDSEALTLIGLGPEQIPVDIYTVDITDLGMSRSTHTEQIRSAFRKFELTNISLDVWEHLRQANPHMYSRYADLL